MTGVAKRLLPKTDGLEHLAILPVYFLINGIDDLRRYHVQVLKILAKIPCIGMSKE